MAAPANSTDFLAWNDAVQNLTIAEAAWAAVADEITCSARTEVESTLRRAKSLLYSIPAPDLAAVAVKLTTIWDENALWEESSDGSQKRRVIGDLQRLALTMAGVPERDASGRSPEEVAGNDGLWVTTLRQAAALQQLLMEGATEDWGLRTAVGLVDEIDEAEARLLSLAAPTLEAVIRKLSIIWEYELYDPETSFACNAIVSDLGRIAELHHQASAQS